MAEQLITNIQHSSVCVLADLVEYRAGKVASLTLAQKDGVGMTLFAIDKGEGLSPHSAPADALVQVLDGTVEITIDGVPQTLTAGQAIVMPAETPHALKAIEPFKFLLTVVKIEDKRYRWKKT
jgi:quercetin dioxygenase-like cupin family protein